MAWASTAIGVGQDAAGFHGLVDKPAVLIIWPSGKALVGKASVLDQGVHRNAWDNGANLGEKGDLSCPFALRHVDQGFSLIGQRTGADGRHAVEALEKTVLAAAIWPQKNRDLTQGKRQGQIMQDGRMADGNIGGRKLKITGHLILIQGGVPLSF